MSTTRKPIKPAATETEHATFRERNGSVALGLATVTSFMLKSYSSTLIKTTSPQSSSLSHCASCGDLHFSTARSFSENFSNKKTQSLPVWSECLWRALSLGDNLDKEFFQVHFSKRRKNRMRNDSALAIAIKRCRMLSSDFLSKIEDDEILQNIDTVVVHDERTEL